jgi:hypothetical protein
MELPSNSIGRTFSQYLQMADQDIDLVSEFQLLNQAHLNIGNILAESFGELL